MILLVAFALETLCATYFLNIPRTPSFFSILYFLAGICISILVLFFPRKKFQWHKTDLNGPENYLRISLIIIAGIFLFFGAKLILSANPIDYRNADMLPVIKTMNERFLHGNWKNVYDNIPQIWSGSKPIYLPFMWLPFSPAVVLHIDLRWVTVSSIMIIYLIFLGMVQIKKNWNFFLPILMIAGVLLCWLVSADDDHGFIGLTEEGVIALFYVTLTLAIISENIFLISITIFLCMMSRYSAIGFVPAFFLYLLINKKKRSALTLAATGLFFILFFFILPFGWHTLVQLIKVPGNYIDFAQIVWRDSPEVFTSGLGFARFFVPEKMHLLHSLLIALTFVIPVLFVLICSFYKGKINFSNMPLATLKMAIVIFYSFIDVPYLYLYYTSVFISLMIVTCFLRKNEVESLQAHQG